MLTFLVIVTDKSLSEWKPLKTNTLHSSISSFFVGLGRWSVLCLGAINVCPGNEVQTWVFGADCQ